MVVYVDDMRRHKGRAIWSHLMADTTEELMQFVGMLGMQEGWLQHPGTPKEHFDVTESRRAYALSLGAVPITYREAGHFVRLKRRGVPFSLELLRAGLL